MATEIKIDQEFKSLIPAISPDELSGLEESIKNEGCRDELIVWGDILLDGHNRLAICEKHGIKYLVRYMDFPDRDAAKLWIICNQLSRRNLTPENKTYLIGIQYKLEKKTFVEAGAMKGKSLDQNDPSSTAERIADQHNVSSATVKRAEKFAEAVDKLSPEEKKEVLSGKSEKSKGEIIKPRKEGGKCRHEEKRKLDGERVEECFKGKYEAFYEEVRKAKYRKWKETSKEAALNCVQWLHDLITIN